MSAFIWPIAIVLIVWIVARVVTGQLRANYDLKRAESIAGSRLAALRDAAGLGRGDGELFVHRVDYQEMLALMLAFGEVKK